MKWIITSMDNHIPLTNRKNEWIERQRWQTGQSPTPQPQPQPLPPTTIQTLEFSITIAFVSCPVDKALHVYIFPKVFILAFTRQSISMVSIVLCSPICFFLLLCCAVLYCAVENVFSVYNLNWLQIYLLQCHWLSKTRWRERKRVCWEGRRCRGADRDDERVEWGNRVVQEKTTY